MDPYRTEKKSTVGAAFGLVLIAVAVVGVIALLLAYPDLLSNLVMLCIVIFAALAVIAVGVFLVGVFLALPMYAKKGVEYQTDISYDLDDVKDVNGKMEEKK